MSTSTALVPTPVGDARISYTRATRPAAALVLGHGAGGGIETADLRALASALPPRGVSVALVEQPWRVAGKKLAPAPKTLDKAFEAIWSALDLGGVPLIAGGRSAGARVACRMASSLGAAGVLALAFPLHPPGRPERSRIEELLGAGVPTLVVQGERDPFGRPEEFARAGYGSEQGALTPVPAADHGFAVPQRASMTSEDVTRLITDSATTWLTTTYGPA